MKNYLFISTHFGSGATVLARILNSNKHVVFPPYTNIEYKNHVSLYELNKLIQGNINLRSYKTTYCDKICIDANLNYKNFDGIAKFILFIRSPENTIKHLVKKKNYSVQSAKDYYFFRLRRIMEMSHFLNDCLYVNYDDFVQKPEFHLDKIQGYLDLSEPLKKYYDLIDDTDRQDKNLSKCEVVENLQEDEIRIPNLNVLNKKYLIYVDRIKDFLS